MTFTHNQFHIQEALLGTMIGRGKRVGNLYIFDFADSPAANQSMKQSHSHKSLSTSSSYSAAFVNSVVSLDVWHQRLGHPSLNKLKILSDVLSPSDTHLSTCQICPLAKQKKLPFQLPPTVYQPFLI